MPLIKARTNRVRTVRRICRVQEPKCDTLMLYARFIGDTTDYVVNQLIDATIGRDRGFLAWRAAQQGGAASQPASTDQSAIGRSRPENHR